MAVVDGDHRAGKAHVIVRLPGKAIELPAQCCPRPRRSIRFAGWNMYRAQRRLTGLLLAGLALTVALALAQPATAREGRQLAGADLQALLSGNTFAGTRNRPSADAFVWRFQAGGTLVAEIFENDNSESVIGSGTWGITDGNACLSVAASAFRVPGRYGFRVVTGGRLQGCYAVVESKGRYWLFSSDHKLFAWFAPFAPDAASSEQEIAAKEAELARLQSTRPGSGAIERLWREIRDLYAARQGELRKIVAEAPEVVAAGEREAHDRARLAELAKLEAETKADPAPEATPTCDGPGAEQDEACQPSRQSIDAWTKRQAEREQAKQQLTAAATPRTAEEVSRANEELQQLAKARHEREAEVQRIKQELMQRTAELQREREEADRLRHELEAARLETAKAEAERQAAVADLATGEERDTMLPLIRVEAPPQAEVGAKVRIVGLVGDAGSPPRLKINDTPVPLFKATGDQAPLAEFTMAFRLDVDTNEIGRRRYVLEACDAAGNCLAREIALDVVESNRPNMASRNFALVIGNDSYRDLANLKTAVADATALAELLTERYAFKSENVTLLLNADRSATLRALFELRKELGPDDRLLIYYAGHGQIDPVTGEGFWQPVDADREEDFTWIDNGDIRRYLKGIPAKHVLVVADSCFSGSLMRGAQRLESLPRDRFYIEIDQSLSRKVISSGGTEPVADSGTGGHSVFAYYFLKTLRENEQPYLASFELFNKLVHAVTNNSSQKPQYGVVPEAGDEGAGDFTFILRSGG